MRPVFSSDLPQNGQWWPHHMKILVTGSTGFIGAEVAQRLAAAGHSVVAVNLRDWRHLKLDLSGGCDAVVHCAWAGVTAQDRDNAVVQSENVGIFKWLLAELTENPPEVFLTFGSQAEIYHQPSAYARAKQECLTLLQDFFPNHAPIKMRWLWLQLFSVYGEGQAADWLIPATVKKLVRDEPLGLTPGEQELDLLHVRDVAGAVVAGLNSGAHGIYEVGSGQSVRVKDIVQALHGLTGSGSKLNFGALPYRAGQIMRACANPNEFNADTGWNPTVDLNDGLRGVVEKIRENTEKETYANCAN